MNTESAENLKVVKSENKKPNNPNEKVTPIWYSEFERNENGAIKETITNYRIILENDTNFKDKIFYNEFSQNITLLSNGEYKDYDDNAEARIRVYIDGKYHIRKENLYSTALRYVAEKHKYHPIKEYLNSLKWDGEKRIATAFADYFGCEDSEYNEYCLRLVLNGAIARILNSDNKEGTKFDYMLILQGEQGQGKSTFFRYMAGSNKYYQENLKDFKGKESFESTQNKWFVECSELAGMNRSSVEDIKSYITTLIDTYRAPYTKKAMAYPRQFVLIGTTNDTQFLQDRTGNRRFLIVKTSQVQDKRKNLFGNEKEVREEFKQMMAEAMYYYKNGECFLTMPERFNDIIEEMQNEFAAENHDKGIIEEYLETIIKNKKQKHGNKFWNKTYKVCVKQIAVEALGHDFRRKVSLADSRNISKILNELPNWKSCGKNGVRINTSIYQDIPKENLTPWQQMIKYGTQKGYEYVIEEDEDYIKMKEQAIALQNGNNLVNKEYIESYNGEIDWDNVKLDF